MAFILTAVKIFQFLYGACCIIGQLAPCRKENLNSCKYRIRDIGDMMELFGSKWFRFYIRNLEWRNAYGTN